MILIAAALLICGASAEMADTQNTSIVYGKEIRTFAGNDSFYVGHGAATGTDSTIFEISASGAAKGLDWDVTNWLDISNLWVPPFVESYMDSITQVVTSGGFLIAAQENETTDSLITYPEGPTAMRVTAWTTAGGANTDTIQVNVQVSMDKIGYITVLHDWIEPATGTTANNLMDDTCVDGVLNIPAGKLYGWKYMRLKVSGDNNHNAAGMSVKLHHWYRMYALPDYGKKMAP